MNQRPTPVTVFGFLNIAFGVLGMAAAPFSIMGALSGGGDSSNPMSAIYSQPLMRNWMLLSGSLGFIAAIVLLAAGVGLLQMKPWARTLSIGYAIYAIIVGLISMVVTMTIIMPAMTAQMTQTAASPEVARVAAIGGVVGGVIGGLFSLIYPVLLLIFMTRPYIAQALESSGYAINTEI